MMKALFSRLIALIMSFLMTVFPFLRPEVSDKLFTVNEDTLTVKLNSNPSTGYKWEVTWADDEVLTKTDEFYTTDAAPGVSGAGGIQSFVFKAVAPGNTTLIFKYQRSWEDIEPEETVWLFCVVDENLNLTVSEIE